MLQALSILAAAYLPGHFLGRALTLKTDSFAEMVLLRVAASFAVAGPILTLLALSGLFTVRIILASLLISAAVCFFVTMKSRRGTESAAHGMSAGGWDLAVLTLVSGAFALYARPAEYVINSRDPGVYTVLAAKLARTGELLSRDPLAGAVASFHTFLEGRKYPGFYLYGHDLIVPQFFPGPFAFLGAGDLAGGVRGSLFVVPVMGALSVGMAFMLGRELFGRWAALAGAALLGASYTQVWWARHPSSEVMTQLLVLAGLWLAVRFCRGAGPATGLLAGLLLGGVMLVRVDAFLASAAIPALFARDVLIRRSPRRWLWPGVPISLFAALALLYLNTIGGRYLYVIYSEHGLNTALSLWPYALVATVVPGGLFLYARRAGGVEEWLEVRGRWISLISALAAVGVSLWGYFVAPVPWESLPDGSRDFYAYQSQILVRLVWFTTPVVAALGLAGFALSAYRLDDRKTILLGAVLSFGVLYAVIPNVSPDLPWATRRFVPTAFPGLCLFAGYAAVEAGSLLEERLPSRRAGASLAAALCALALGLTLYTSFPILRFQELDGLVGQVESLNEEIPDSKVVYMEMPEGYDVAASTFEYIYGRPVLPYDRESFRREAERLEAAGLLDDAAYITTDGGPAPLVSGLDFREVGGGELDAPRIKPVEKELPTEAERLRVTLRIYEIERD